MNSKSINKKTAFSKTYLLFFLSLLICIAAGLQLTKSLGEHALEEVVEKVELASSALIGYVDNELEEVQGLVKVMAHSPWMFPALTLRDSDSIAKANSTLDRYGSSFRVSVAYLMDFDGIVVASSNRHLAESFVGKSYKFRPYFQKAVKGKCGEYFALGATSGKRGYYASYPVKDYSGNVVGVAVIKKNLDHIEQLLSKHEHSYFIDENGIIFLSGD